MTDITGEIKAEMFRHIDVLADRFVAISADIHRHPEPGLAEHHACDLLSRFLISEGFETKVGIAGLETAFVAAFKGPEPGSRIAFLAEYDALPDLGHACGHNIIAAAAVGAAVALKKIVSRFGGTVMVIGTPDEEAVGPTSRGGKVVMTRAGVFDDIDAALMVHPIGGQSAAWGYSFPLKDFLVSFKGQAAHYTVPHEGKNALESLLLFLSAVNTIKRGWPPNVMFAYTITDGGGESPIVVPARAEAHIAMKAFYAQHLEALFAQVQECAHRIGRITGTKASVRMLGEYRNMIPNLTLAECMYYNMQLIGEPVTHPKDSQAALKRLTYPGISTDFGDVSWHVPAIHAFCAIGGSDLVAHTAEFAEAAGSMAGQRALIMSIKALAATGIDILTRPELADELKAEFDLYRSTGFSNVPGIPPDYLPFEREI